MCFTSRSNFDRTMTGTNLKANCMYFERRKNASKIFPALLKLQNIFHGYPTTKKKKKKFLVIYTLIQPELEIIFIIYVV